MNSVIGPFTWKEKKTNEGMTHTWIDLLNKITVKLKGMKKIRVCLIPSMLLLIRQASSNVP